jgi:hypothetical protein
VAWVARHHRAEAFRRFPKKGPATWGFIVECRKRGLSDDEIRDYLLTENKSDPHLVELLLGKKTR